MCVVVSPVCQCAWRTHSVSTWKGDGVGGGMSVCMENPPSQSQGHENETAATSWQLYRYVWRLLIFSTREAHGWLAVYGPSTTSQRHYFLLPSAIACRSQQLHEEQQPSTVSSAAAPLPGASTSTHLEGLPIPGLMLGPLPLLQQRLRVGSRWGGFRVWDSAALARWAIGAVAVTGLGFMARKALPDAPPPPLQGIHPRDASGC